MDKGSTGVDVQHSGHAKLVPACECGWLGTVLNDENPVVKYNEQMQWLYVDASGTQLIIHHCPICGGRFPSFSDLSQLPLAPPEERARIRGLTERLLTIDDVINALGTPDYEGNISDGISEFVVRNVEYYNISPWYNLEFYITESELTLRIMPKPINSNNAASTE